MKKILLTGAGGFLGSKIISEWKKDYGLLLASTGSLRYSENEYVEIIDRNEILKDDYKFTDIDIIVNCAFPITQDGIDFYRGLDYLKTLIVKAEASSIPIFVNISSQSVYDPNRESPAKEDDPLCIRDSYSAGKYMIEALLSSVCKKMNYTNIRLASLIGVGLDSRIINRFVESAVQDKKINVFKGNQQFEYMDVVDAAKGIIAFCNCLDIPKLKNTYNLGINQTYNLEELAELVKQVGCEMGIDNIFVSVDKVDVCSNNTLDSSRFYERINWRPQLSMLDSIRQIYQDKLGTHITD